MEYVDKLMPVFALVGIGVFLLFLLRLARSEPASRRVEKSPLPVAAPVVVPVAAPVESNVTKEVAESEVQADVLKKQPARKAHASAIDHVLDLLKSEDSLATAFLLREILGPPVSRRR